MALSREKGPVYTTISIPLSGYGDDNWEDNTWIVEHLRQLADTIEEDQLKIYTMGVEMDAQYKKPSLVLKCFESRDWEKIEVPEFTGEKIEDYGNLVFEIKKIEDFHNFGGADKLCEKYGVTRQEYNWFVHQVRFGPSHGDAITSLMLAQK